MNKIKKILFTLVLSLLFVVNTDAIIKEDPVKFTEDTYIIGITKFDKNIIVNASMANQAGIDYANFMQSINNDDLTSDVYFYSKLTDEWFKISKNTNEYKLLNENEKEELINNLNIFYVNNEEKTTTLDYNGNVSKISNSKVKFENNKFIIPVTLLNFNFTTVDDITLDVDLAKDKDGINNYGEYYIPYIVSYYDEEQNLIGTIKTNKDGSLNLSNFTIPTKDGYKHEFVDSEGNVVDINTLVVSDNLTKIYDKWTKVGSLMENNVSIFDKDSLTLKYTGLIDRNDNSNYISVTIVAPINFDTTNTLVNGESVKWISGVKNTAEIKLDVKDKSSQKITVKWDDIDTTVFTVDLSESKFNYHITYKEGNTTKNVEFVTEGEKLSNIYEYTKKDKIFVGLTTTKNGRVKFDTNTPITKDYTFYPIYTEPVLSYNNEVTKEVEYAFVNGEESNQIFKLFYSKVTSGKFKLVVEFKDTNAVYDENDYIKAKINDEWVDFKDGVTFDVNEKGYTEIPFKVKMTNNTSTSYKYSIYYNDKLVLSKTIVNGLTTEENITLSIGKYKFTNTKASKIMKYGTEKTPVKLLKDVTLTGVANISGNSYIDLNGFTLTNKEINSIFEFSTTNATNDNSLNIYNGNLNLASTKKDTYVVNGGKKSGKGKFTLTMTDVKVTSNNETFYMAGTNSKIELNNVTVNSKNNAFFIEGKNPVVVINDSKLITDEVAIYTNGSTSSNTNITLDNSKIISKSMGIYQASSGVLTISNNSSVTGTTGIGLKSGQLNVLNSTIVGNGVAAESPKVENSGISNTGDAIYVEVNSGYQSVTKEKSDISVSITNSELTSTANNSIRVFNPEEITGTLVLANDYNISTENTEGKFYTLNK